MRINQNVMAFNASRNLSGTNVQLGKSLEKLSSGFRINRAGDDAAGLVISQGLRAQISGLQQATRNAQDGISVVQTAEGALNEVHSMLNRMRDLAVQASNTGSTDAAAASAIQAEIGQLIEEVDRIAAKTTFGTMGLLDGSYGATAASVTGTSQASFAFAGTETFELDVNGLGNVTVNLADTGGAVDGATAAASLQTSVRAALAASADGAIQAFADKVTVTSQDVGGSYALSIEVSGLSDGQTFALTDGAGTPLVGVLGMDPATVTAAAGTGGSFQVGANSGDSINVVINSVTTSDLGLGALDVTSFQGAQDAIDALDAAISNVSETRGDLGAIQNRFESTINNLSVTTENLAASESRIRDTDMASEMVTFTRNQVLQQAGTAMLAQANQVPQTILALLR